MDVNNTNHSSSYPWRFALVLTVDLPSLACSLFLMHHLLTKRTLRRALHNHTIIALLFVILVIQFVDMPFYLDYFHHGSVRSPTAAMCLTWWYTNFTARSTVLVLLAWLSFERHIFVFHGHLVGTRAKRWLFHYCPLIFFTLYPLAFELLGLLLPSCRNEHVLDETKALCRYSPCYYTHTLWRLYDILVNGLVPCLVIAVCSVGLLLRIFRTKQVCLRGSVRWRRYRKMTVQILLIAAIFECSSLPLLIFSLLSVCGSLPSNVSLDLVRHFLCLANVAVLFLPFVLLVSLPKQIWRAKWRKQFDNLRKHCRNRTVVPAHVC